MKKTRLTKYVFLLCFMVTSLATYAQTGSISGKVTDESGQPLLGATIVVKGTTRNAIVNEAGEFRITGVSNGTVTLQVRIIGYKTKEQQVTVNGDVTVNVQLSPDTQGLNEVVVVGYGTQKKGDLTGSITAITAKDFNKGPSSTPEQLIMGKVPGVQITTNGGAPGSGSRIRIRSGSSLNASNEPLYVIDGVPLDNSEVKGTSNPLSFINPNDIESFNILKDASATAIYGSRASNGVVIITTKKGKKGDKLHVNFSSLNSVSKKVGEVDVLSADQFRQVVKEHGAPAQQALLGTANTNWQDAIYQTALSTDNNISLSGSLKALPYRLSIGYLGQEGIVKTSSLKRTSASLSLNPRFFNDNLKVDINVKGTNSDTRFADMGAINAAVAFDPTQPIHANNDFGGYFEWLEPATGKPNTLATRNPLAMLELKDDRGNLKRSIGNIQLDYRLPFLPELRANLNVGYDVSKTEGRTLIPAYAGNMYQRGGQNKPYSQKKQNKLLEFYLNYTKDLKNIKSKIDVTGGYSYQDFIRDEPGYADYNEKGEVINAAGNPFKTQSTLISVFGRVNYNYNEKYLFTATVRRDGSSRFAQHWGTFPSAALAWRISQEPFLKNSTVLSDLKLRLGFGITGQQDLLVDYPYLPRYTLSDSTARYQMGSKYYLTLRPEGYDSNIKWEETKTYNAGLDFGFLNGRLSGSVDYYIKKTSDLLSVIPVPAGSNLTNELLTNVGNIENKGVEFALNANPVSTSRFNWDAGFNITYNKSKITNLSKVNDPNSQGILVGVISGGVGNNVQIHTVGYAPYSFYLYKQLYDKDGKPEEGKYEDVTGDGNISNEDKVRFKSPDPKVFLGFNSQFSYDKWSLSFALRGSFGNYVYNNVSSDNGAYRNFSFSNYLTNVSSSVLKTNFATSQFFSDYYLENASFVRMDNISLGYNFGRIMKNKVGLRLAASVQNVFVITDYSGLDPEVGISDASLKPEEKRISGIDNKMYPRPRTYSLGVNLDF